MKKLVIIGVGLLGGSIGLAARRRRLAGEVWGFGRDLGRLNAAKRKGCLTHATTDLAAACRGADLMVLCTPFTLFESLLRKISGCAPKGCLVTEVGSVKGRAVALWERAASPLAFIASHPMAGSENTGAAHAQAGLFEAAPCIITPTRRSAPKAKAAVAAFWRALGCRVCFKSPAEHDQLIGRFSHLTHALAFALSSAAGRGLKKADFALAGPSYWGNTRIAASDPQLWADIFDYNRAVVAKEVDAAISELCRLKSLKGAALRAWLAKVSDQARKRRP